MGTKMTIERFQSESWKWLTDTFPTEVVMNHEERALRFLEEAIEVAQACGVKLEKVHALADYTYDRPVGEVQVECGDALFTLALLAERHGVDLQFEATEVLARAYKRQDEIRSKSMAKQFRGEGI